MSRTRFFPRVARKNSRRLHRGDSYASTVAVMVVVFLVTLTILLAQRKGEGRAEPVDLSTWKVDRSGGPI